MSQDVNVTGKLIPVDLGELTLEEKALELIYPSQHDMVEYYDSAVHYLITEQDYYYDDKSETLFEIFKMGNNEGSFINLTKNDDGTLSFNTNYYNGAANLNDMLGYGFQQLDTSEG